MLQLALTLWASVPLAGRTDQGGVRWSGLLTGAALVTHNSSLFLLPALALLVLWQGGNRFGRLVRWLAGVAASTALGYGLCGSSFPPDGLTTCSTWLESRHRSSSTGS